MSETDTNKDIDTVMRQMWLLKVIHTEAY